MTHFTLVTGASGYLGVHLVQDFLQSNRPFLGISSKNFSILPISSRSIIKSCSLTEEKELTQLLSTYPVTTIIHLAHDGLESDNNIKMMKNILGNVKRHRIQNLIFVSSSSVYGESLDRSEEKKEISPLSPLSSYAREKIALEQMMRDFYLESPHHHLVVLRLFNPISFGKNMPIGRNILSHIIRAYLKEAPFLSIFGNDHATPDGTCLRDYLHIDDWCGFINALLDYLDQTKEGFDVFNVGSGISYSILDLVHMFQKVSGVSIAYQTTVKKEGDISVSCADMERTYQTLGWKAHKTIEDMCLSAFINLKSL